MASAKIQSIADDIISLYKKYGSNEYSGEKVTQLDHMVQAANLARQGGFPEEMILAAFLHDIGHICSAAYTVSTMGDSGVMNHEKIGAQFLRKRGFSEHIVQLVENHVSAKRYLTFKYPQYFEELSDASKKTLEYQGGVMNPDEAILFEHDPYFEDFIEMRRWDELAKEMHRPLELSLDYFHQLLVKHLESQVAVAVNF